jgi:hypothetical protein
MSDVPPRPRIRPATSDDWQKDHSEPAGQNPSPGGEAGSSRADFDNSTYYEYLERHTGEHSVSKSQSGNLFAPIGRSAFDDDAVAGQPQQPAGANGVHASRNGLGAGSSAHPSYPSGGGSQSPPPPPQLPPSVPVAGGYSGSNGTAGSKSRTGFKITLVVVALVMVLALVAFFGIRWLAPSSGTVPVDVGGGETSQPSPSPTDTLVQPTQSAEDKLDSYTEEGTKRAADLEGQWVTQVSAKNVGLKADGKTWTAPDILNEYEANKVKYPGAILIHSGDWASYKDGNYWVTVIDTGYSDPEPALDKCRSWGLDRDHCLAKRLVKDGSPKNNSAYLDE